MNRHEGLAWSQLQARLEADAEKLWSLYEMERTGGEPDVVGHDQQTGESIFDDCSAESPKGRRSLCYDRAALDSRKENKPQGNAMDMTAGIGIELLTEKQYRELQKLGNFDNKTSSWVETPSAIRKLGGAIFCDRRYDTVFLYHNGAESTMPPGDSVARSGSEQTLQLTQNVAKLGAENGALRETANAICLCIH